MFTSVAGSTFLKAYNEKNKINITAKQFFDQIFLPLFFDHNKYMMTAGNSPLENPRIKWEKMIKEEIQFESVENRQKRIIKMKEKIKSHPIDASIAVGYQTENETFGNTGQITSMNIVYTKDDIYLSWIGSALGVCVQGGYNILYNDTKLLMDIYSGWIYYRDYLTRYPLLRGNQINTWNGVWLCHIYDRWKYDQEHPMYGIDDPVKSVKELLEFPTVSWVNVVTKIAQMHNSPQYLGYVYNIGQTNTTVGFIPFELPQIRKPYELYRRIFGEDAYLKDETKMIKIFGGEYGFQAACQKGSIGIEALEPKGLRDYIYGSKGKIKMPDYRKADEDQVVTFNTYKIWVLAMLNNEQLWEKSLQIANALVEYASGGKKGKMDHINTVEKFLVSSTKKSVIENIIPMIQNASEKVILYSFCEAINKMSNEDNRYFLTLIRFQYAYKKSESDKI